MTKIYEIKDKAFKFCAEYEVYLKYICKFVIALILFCIINSTIGFMERINSFPVVLILALVCCLLPQGMTLLIAAVLVLLHLYVLSIEVAVTALLIFAVLFLLYFRFAPQDGVLVTITPILHAIGIPYVLPIGAGLLRNAYSASAIACGTVAYYFLAGIYENAKALQSVAVGREVEAAKMTITAAQLLANREMYLVIGVLILSTIVVRVVRKLVINHAWKIAIVSGGMIQIAGLFAGYLVFNLTEKAIGMIIGNIVAIAIGFVLEFLYFDLDYSRTERVQFEDDEYYYFVKAVPKKNVTITDRNVKEFNGFSAFGKKKNAQESKVSRKDIAEELGIDEDILK